MTRVARSTLVLCTAIATLFAATLQGRVLCSANAGEHFAIEQPHHDTGCPDRHDRHDRHAEDGGDEHAPTDCTDISADFSLAREVVPASPDVFHAPLLDVSPLSSVSIAAASPAHATYAHTWVEHPPGSGELTRLRTIVLLA